MNVHRPIISFSFDTTTLAAKSLVVSVGAFLPQNSAISICRCFFLMQVSILNLNSTLSESAIRTTMNKDLLIHENFTSDLQAGLGSYKTRDETVCLLIRFSIQIYGLL